MGRISADSKCLICDEMRSRSVKKTRFRRVRNICYFLVDLLPEASSCGKLWGNSGQSQVKHWSDQCAPLTFGLSHMLLTKMNKVLPASPPRPPTDRCLNTEEGRLYLWVWLTLSFCGQIDVCFFWSWNRMSNTFCRWTERWLFCRLLFCCRGRRGIAHVLKARLRFCWPSRTMCPHPSTSLSARDSGPLLPSFSLVMVERLHLSLLACACHVSLNLSSHSFVTPATLTERRSRRCPCSHCCVKVEGKPSLKAHTAHVTASWMWCIIFRLILLLRQRF